MVRRPEIQFQRRSASRHSDNQRMSLTIETAVSNFGKAAKSKLANPAAAGQPEDQLRAPFEQLLEDAATLCNFHAGAVIAVGETSQHDLKTRPDYSTSTKPSLASSN